MHKSENWWIAGGRILDPAAGRDEVRDIYVIDGRIRYSAPAAGVMHKFIAEGCVVIPGLIDLHTHLRDPGNPEAETIASGTAAAARGGFTAVVAMPNTRPPLDTPEAVRDQAERGAREGSAVVLPCGCLTRGRSGIEAADLEALQAAGAVAFSDDGSTPLDEALFMEIARTAQRLELPVLDHAEDTRCSAAGVMHEGAYNRQLGLAGIPEEAEILAVERDIRVAATTGCWLHIQHVSCASSVEMIRRARDRGIPVSGEVTPHHLWFCDRDVTADNTSFKMNPPLRSAHDRQVLREAVLDGTLAVLATDHAPHSSAAKARGFVDAPFGVTGLETALAVTYSLLVLEAGMPVMAWLRRWTTGPARVLGRTPPRLDDGQPGDVVVFDPGAEHKLESADFLSLSTNSPFSGVAFHGRVLLTLLGGRRVWCDGDAAKRLKNESV